MNGMQYKIPHKVCDADYKLLGLKKPTHSPSKYIRPKIDVIKINQSSHILQSGVTLTAVDYIKNSPFAQNHKQITSVT